jgi:hypothetical protein
MMPPDVRLKLMDDIAAHLASRGPREWETVRARWPEVSRATFFRLVKTFRDRPADPARLEEARRELAHRAAGEAEAGKAAAGSPLPAPPSPDWLAKNGDHGRGQLDLMGRLQRLFDDADRLRTFSLSPDGKGVRNPLYFVQSASLAEKLINTALRAWREVYDLQRTQDFYNAIIEEIAAESPDCAKRIMGRLARLDAEFGMTVGARVC